MVARRFVDWLRTLGSPEDPVATDVSSSWSAMSLLKAIYQQIEDGAFSGGGGGGISGVSGPVSSVVGNLAKFTNTTGDVIGDSTVGVDIDGTLGANSDLKIPTQKAVKTYAAPKASPVFTGNPTAPTPTALDADASIATKEYVDDAVGGVVAGTVADDSVTNAKLAEMAAGTVKANLTAGTANPTDATFAALKTAMAFVKADVGLGSADNTPDTGKPVSTAQQTALDLKANLAAPTFTGVPRAPTASAGTNTTQLATTAFVLANAATLDTDGTMAADSDTVAPSQKAVRTYVTATVSGVPTFIANKNAAAQSGIVSATDTKLTFTTEASDIGSWYDSTNSKATPVAGVVMLSARVLVNVNNLTNGSQITLKLYKNGAIWKQQTVVVNTTTSVAQALSIMTFDVCNGSDYYEVYINITTSASTATVNGAIANTEFMGTMLVLT